MLKRPKYEPTDSYFYLSRLIGKFVMRAYAFNLHVDPIRKKLTDTEHIPILQIFDLKKSKSKGIIKDRTYCKSVLWTRVNQKVYHCWTLYGGERIRKRSQKYQHKLIKRCN